MTDLLRLFECGLIWLRRRCILTLILVNIPASALSATITDLSLGGISYATGINASGQVVGYSTTGSGNSDDAFLYSNGAMTNIGSLINGVNSMAEGINNAGQVVGSYSPSPGNSQAFLYSGGAVSPVGTLTAAYSINDAGQIVGNAPFSIMSSIGPLAANLAALYSGGSVTALGELGTLCGSGQDYTPLDACSSNATAINDSGQIAGTSLNPGGSNTAVLYSGGGVKALYPPVTSYFEVTIGGQGQEYTASFPSAAYAINSAGDVVGYDYDFTPYVGIEGSEFSGDLAFEYSPAVGLINLGLGIAFGINDLGQVVGSSGLPSTSCTYSCEALLWSNGVQTNLNSLLAPNSGWVLTSAVGINDAGQIVGNGLLNGQEQAFLLDTQTPSAPEPGSFVLLSAGATLLLTIVSTRRIRIHRDRQNPHPAVAETAYLGAGDSYSPEPVPGAGFVGIRRLSVENGVTRMWP